MAGPATMFGDFMEARRRQYEQLRDRATLPQPGLVKQADVKVTAYDAGTDSYSWTKVLFGTDGTPYDDPADVTGGPTRMPLKERNGNVISAFPYYAKAWVRVAASDNGPVWEFDAPGGAGVSLVGSTSGTFTAAALASPTQNLFTVLGAGFYHLIGTFSVSSPLGSPSTQQFCQTTVLTPIAGTPNIWGSEFPATAGSWTTDTQTLSCLFSYAGSGNTISLQGNTANSIVQTMTYAYKCSLLQYG